MDAAFDVLGLEGLHELVACAFELLQFEAYCEVAVRWVALSIASASLYVEISSVTLKEPFSTVLCISSASPGSSPPMGDSPRLRASIFHAERSDLRCSPVTLKPGTSARRRYDAHSRLSRKSTED